MNALVFGLAAVAIAAIWVFMYGRQDRKHPLWMAFATTFAAVVLLVSGAAGFNLNTHHRFVAGTQWSDTVVWSQIWIGIAASPVAAFFWRRGLRKLRAETSPR